MSTILSNDPNADPHSNYTILSNTITKLIDKYTTTKRVKLNKHKHKKTPWITNDIIQSIKQRDKLHLKWKRSQPNTPEKQNLKINISTYTKIIKKNIRKAKTDYYARTFQQHQNDPKKTWEKINEFLNRKPIKDSTIEHLNISGTQMTDPQSITDSLNSYFINIGQKLASTISTPQNAYKQYLPHMNTPAFNFHTITEHDTIKLIDSLSSKYSSTSDKINTLLLKSLKHELSLPICIITNQIITTAIFPTALKTAKVIPIFKKDNPHECNNYRPISILPAISKIIEKALLQQLHIHFLNNNLFFNSQYGFRKNRSTEQAALELSDRILAHMDNNKTPISIFLDLSKAFDTLNHTILLQKLKYYGITGKSLDLCQNYLSNRQQYTQYNNTSSKLQSITTGVPQGSIFGPFLFLIYVNDFHNCTQEFSMIHYADDTTLSTTLDSPNSTNNSLNDSLKQIHHWLNANKLILNISKTKYMIFHTPQKHIAPPLLHINNTAITRVDNFDFLGITFNEHMNWKSHHKKISLKIGKTIGILNKIKHIFPNCILLKLYQSLILPQLNYGILLWANNANSIATLQKRALRSITNSKYNAHTDPLFKKLRLLKLYDIRKFFELKFFFKLQNGNLPEYFLLNNFTVTHGQIHHQNTRNQSNLALPTHRHHFFKSSLKYTLINTVNNLPPDLKLLIHTHSLQAFSSRIKQHFINRYDPNCNIPNCYICSSASSSQMLSESDP